MKDKISELESLTDYEKSGSNSRAESDLAVDKEEVHESKFPLITIFEYFIRKL